MGFNSPELDITHCLPGCSLQSSTALRESKQSLFKNFLNPVLINVFDRNGFVGLNIQNKSNNFLSYSILPHAISDKRGDIEFNLTRVPEKSSTYEPNDKVLKKFPDFQRFELTKKINLSSVPMDEILED